MTQDERDERLIQIARAIHHAIYPHLEWRYLKRLENLPPGMRSYWHPMSDCIKAAQAVLELMDK